MIEIKNARKEQSPDIARLIMTAMTDDCCLHFCGVGYGLEDFRVKTHNIVTVIRWWQWMETAWSELP